VSFVFSPHAVKIRISAFKSLPVFSESAVREAGESSKKYSVHVGHLPLYIRKARMRPETVRLKDSNDNLFQIGNFGYITQCTGLECFQYPVFVFKTV
jgi:hypothetical protein